MILELSEATRDNLIDSTKRFLYEQDTSFAPTTGTFLGAYDDKAEELVYMFIDELQALSPTLTY